MKRSLVPVKGFIKNISPFNNRDDMPSALLITKKLLAFFTSYYPPRMIGIASFVLRDNSLVKAILSPFA